MTSGHSTPPHPTATPIAVIGGSGLYSLFDPEVSTSSIVPTPYGDANITTGELGGHRVVFLTRHGSSHSVAPHLINYRANIWALASLGVKAILSSSAVGGLDSSYPPGTLVLTDQFIDRTHGRPDTFYDRGSVQHLAAADPFCPVLHSIAATALRDAGTEFAPTGTCVVIQGPRFSTRAESVWFQAAGGHTVNMTLYPEVALASELGIGTANLSFVTDSDAGVGVVEPEADVAGELRVAAGQGDGASGGSASEGAASDEVSQELVYERLRAAQPRIIAAIEAIIRAIPDDYEPRELIPAAEVAAVLARAVAST